MDFLSKQEARSAADAVAGTHLYGRRLVSQSSDANGTIFSSQIITVGSMVTTCSIGEGDTTVDEPHSSAHHAPTWRMEAPN